MMFYNASDVKNGWTSTPKARTLYAWAYMRNGKTVKSGFSKGKEMVNLFQWKRANSANFLDFEYRPVFNK